MAGQRPAVVPQGRAGRGRRGPQGVRRLVGRDRVQPRPDPLPHRGDAGGPPRAVRRARSADGRGPVQGEGRGRRWTRRSTAGSGTRAGPTRSARSWAAANPVAGPFFNLSTPEPTGVVAVLAPQESSFLGLVSVLAPVIVTGNTAVVVAVREVPAARALPGARCWPPPTCPAAWSTSCPAVPRRSPAAGRAPGRQRDRPGRAPTRRWRRSWRSAAADNLKRVLRPQACATGRPTRAPAA